VGKEAPVIHGQHILQDFGIVGMHSSSLLLWSLVLLICDLFGHFKKLKINHISYDYIQKKNRILITVKKSKPFSFLSKPYIYIFFC